MLIAGFFLCPYRATKNTIQRANIHALFLPKHRIAEVFTIPVDTKFLSRDAKRSKLGITLVSGGCNWAKHLRTLIFKRYSAIKNGLISGFISHLKLGETLF